MSEDRNMTKTIDTQRPPLVNIILVIIVALASLATLASDGISGQSSASMSWIGKGHQFMITMAPVEDRLQGFEYDGALYLDLDVENIIETSVDKIRWTLNIETERAEGYFKSGGFTFDHYNGQEDSRGLYGNAITRIGPLCQNQEDPIEECIPCDMDEGCNLTINVDLCYPDSSNRKSFSVRITREDSSKFYRSCNDTSDVSSCRELSEWLDIEGIPLEMNLCSE